MKKITLELTQDDLFNIACLQMGYCMSEDAETELSLIKLYNVSIITKEMNEFTLSEFEKLMLQFKSQTNFKEDVNTLFDKIQQDLNILLNKIN